MSRSLNSFSKALEGGFGLLFELIDLPIQCCQGNIIWEGGWVGVLGGGHASQVSLYGLEFGKDGIKGCGLEGDELPQGGCIIEEDVM